ncbi:hypothetical protein [Clostridium sp.]|uniref:hypothetical protein n=1 Tax=Clostridium sp. TaxID=1506 RepID=UPI001A5B9C31|nr:hypothetical protein [Clostridium sp.]MBK5236763.1 hypothetical protein [Clostridium sp.]
MNFITSHIEQEKVEIEVSELRNVGEIKYRTLEFGINSSITLSPAQAEELFNKLDAKLHKKTYTVLEDECLTMESDLAVANEIIEDLEDKLQENFK